MSMISTASGTGPRPFAAMGCWNFGGDYWKKEGREVYRKILRAALDAGITHFDTAPAYGNGESEQILGQLLKKELLKKAPDTRKQLTVSSKFFPTLPTNVYKGLRRSLGRLFLDDLDIYYIHWPNEKCDMAGIMAELEKAREEGLIRHIGVSNFSVEQMEEVIKYGRLDYCQTAYSLLWRYPEEEIIPWCRSMGVEVIAYSPLAQGLLKAPHEASRPLLPREDPRRQLVFFRDEPELVSVLRQLENAAVSEGFSLPEAALGWLAERGTVNGILAGFRRPEQAVFLASVADSAAPRLPDGLMENLDKISLDYRLKLKTANPGVENIWDHRR